MSIITDLSRLGPDPEMRAPGPAIGARWLGHSLREVRRRQGLSRAHVAHSAGMTKRELAAYENGRLAVPEIDLCSLAGSCGVEVDELIGVRSLASETPPSVHTYPENPFAVLRDVDQTSPADPVIAAAADHSDIKWTPDATANPSPTLGDLESVDEQWRIGGIFPLTLMGEGRSLQHADAQWALADANAPDDVGIEAVVDFAAGAGFGVLFRASLDAAERISGYAFEVDPSPGSGGYVLRSWKDNRAHWCPLSRAIVTQPQRLFGRHTIQVQLVGDRLTVAVDGDQVLVIPSLVDTTARVDAEVCTGSSVGVLSRATTDITVPTFRVAHS